MSRFYTNFYARGNKIYLRGYQNGKRIDEEVEYQPYLFIPSVNGDYLTLDNKKVGKVNFSTMREARDFVKQYSDITNFKFYGLTNYPYVFINDEYPGQIDYDPEVISVVTIDIEVASDDGFPDIKLASKPITAISLRKNGRSIVFGCGYYKPKSDDVIYVLCKDEKDLLAKFILIWNHPDWAPDVLTGWNVEFFDVPYIVNRIIGQLGEKEAKKLSPWKFLDEKEIIVRDQKNQAFVPAGITILDYMHLYKKFSFTNQESYRLDHIANIVLGERKLDYSEYDSLLDLYKKDYEKFIDYNIHDCVLVDRLEDKLGFIKQVFALAYDAKVNYNDTLTTVRPWDVIIHNYLLDQKIVIPQQKIEDNYDTLVGGYVKDPQVGMHKWVVSFDLNSLYPHLIMQYNISPETFMGRRSSFPSIDNILNGDFLNQDPLNAVTANGCLYSKTKQGFLPALMEKMYNDRVVYKDKMIEAKKKFKETKNKDDEKLISRYHNLQLAKKIQLNSAYGALGNQYFRWFNFNHAEAITTSGQLSIKWIEQKINAYFNKLLKTENTDYVIASDTDSVYVNMGPLVEKLDMTDDLEIVKALDAFCEQKIQPYINKSYQELGDVMSAYQQKMQMKRENISNKGIWKAKKMYILNVWNSEGVQYEKPELKIMGIEAVRSSTPASCRENIKKTLDLIMNSDQKTVLSFIEEFREKFFQMEFEEVAFPRGVKLIFFRKNDNGNAFPMHYKLDQKSLPIQVRASLLYNKVIKDAGLEKKHQPITNGDKIKFAYLITPNPITRQENVIATNSAMPKQLEINKYIDYEKQFDKAFLDPIKAILDVLHWKVNNKKVSTLEDWFA